MFKLENLFIYSDLLPILVILLFVRKIKELPIWVIFLYCSYSFANNMIIIYNDNHGIGFRKLLYFFTLFEYLLFAAVLFLSVKNKIVRKTILLLSPAFALFCVYYIFVGKLKKFDSLQTSIECIIIIVLCLYYFYEQLVSPQYEFIYNNYTFWIVVGLLLYLAGSFFLFVFAASLSNVERQGYWPILYVCGVLRNILFAIAVYLSTRPRDDEPYQSMI